MPPGRLTESGKAGRGHEPPVVQVVLDHHRHTVERTAGSYRSVLVVEGGRDRQGVGVHGDQGVVVAFITVDPVEEGLCQFHGRELASSVSRLYVSDAELDDVDQRGGRGRGRGQGSRGRTCLNQP